VESTADDVDKRIGRRVQRMTWINGLGGGEYSG
jgi:plasmid replication initiation protein